MQTTSPNIPENRVHINMINMDSNTKNGDAKTGLQEEGRNKSMERESKGCLNVVLYMTLYINIDVWKQVTTYGIKYYNGGVYPVPQTFVVTVTELLKLAIFIVVAAREGILNKIKFSPLYAIPSLIYAVNNNIYFFALNYTTPPIWNIVIQMRILVTAVAYRVIFKKVITPVQWLALFLLILAIVATQFTAGDVSGIAGADLTIPLMLAAMGSITSTAGAIIMEYLYKNDWRNFSEMQIQLYLFGSIGSAVLYGLETHSQNNMTPVGGSQQVWFLLVACVVMSCLTGVVVAIIVKRLDNIVKLYTQALTNMATSIACTFFFPDDFHLNLEFFGCLALMMVAISLYESKEMPVVAMMERFCRRMSVEKLALFVVLTLAAAICMFAVA